MLKCGHILSLVLSFVQQDENKGKACITDVLKLNSEVALMI